MKRGKGHRKGESIQTIERSTRVARRNTKPRQDSEELLSWKNEDSNSDGERRKRREQKRQTRLPTDNMSEVKIRLKGFKSSKYDSTAFKPKPARYQAVEEITFEEL